MAYNQRNQAKRDKYILDKYQEYKKRNSDRTDTFIVRRILPDYGIFISIRTLHNVLSGRTYRKQGQEVSDPAQLKMF